MGVISVDNGEQLAILSTEHSLSQMTGIGTYVLRVDVSVMQVGDTLEIRIDIPCIAGDANKQAYLETLNDVQDNQIYHSIPIPIASGEEINPTITQTAGTGRSYRWNLLRI